MGALTGAGDGSHGIGVGRLDPARVEEWRRDLWVTTAEKEGSFAISQRMLLAMHSGCVHSI
jgi:hypothetical protein